MQPGDLDEHPLIREAGRALHRLAHDQPTVNGSAFVGLVLEFYEGDDVQYPQWPELGLLPAIGGRRAAPPIPPETYWDRESENHANGITRSDSEYETFTARWSTDAPALARSLEDAGTTETDLQLLCGVARAANELDWSALAVDGTFAVIAWDLSRLRDRIELSVPAALFERLDTAGRLPPPGQSR